MKVKKKEFDLVLSKFLKTGPQKRSETKPTAQAVVPGGK